MARGRPLEVEQEFLEAFRLSGLVSEYIVSVLPSDLWRADPPSGRGRSACALVAQRESVRGSFGGVGGAERGEVNRNGHGMGGGSREAEPSRERRHDRQPANPSHVHPKLLQKANEKEDHGFGG